MLAPQQTYNECIIIIIYIYHVEKSRCRYKNSFSDVTELITVDLVVKLVSLHFVIPRSLRSRERKNRGKEWQRDREECGYGVYRVGTKWEGLVLAKTTTASESQGEGGCKIGSDGAGWGQHGARPTSISSWVRGPWWEPWLGLMDWGKLYWFRFRPPLGGKGEGSGRGQAKRLLNNIAWGVYTEMELKHLS